MNKRILISAILGIAPFAITPVSAQEIYAFQLGVYPKCDGCHTGGELGMSDSVMKRNLMPEADAAYRKDKFNLTGLKAFLEAASSPASPAVQTCATGQILNTTTNVCETPKPAIPTCSNGQVLNVAKNVCETPKPATPNCTGKTVLNADKTACVASPAPIIPPKPVPSAAVVEVAAKNTKPVLNQIATQWDAVVGETLAIPLSVQDAEQDEFKILSTSGLKFSNTYIDATTQLPTIDLLWTPTAKQVNTIQTFTFQAKETRAKSPLTSNKVSARIRVWANENRDISSITRLNVGTYALKNGKLNLSGSVVFSNLLASAERSAFIAKKLPLTISDSTGVILATTPLTLDNTGNWSVSVTANLTSCDVVLEFEGQKVARTLAGCAVPVAKVSSEKFANAILVASRDDDDDHKGHEHDDHDD